MHVSLSRRQRGMKKKKKKKKEKRRPTPYANSISIAICLRTPSPRKVGLVHICASSYNISGVQDDNMEECTRWLRQDDSEYQGNIEYQKKKKKKNSRRHVTGSTLCFPVNMRNRHFKKEVEKKKKSQEKRKSFRPVPNNAKTQITPRSGLGPLLLLVVAPN